MKWILSLFLCWSASAQLPVIPYVVPLLSSSLTVTNFAPYVAEAWEFTNNSVTTNASVTNWIGQIQHIPMTNGASTLRPTNSASGLGFGASEILTNIPINMGSNYVLSVVFQCQSDIKGAGNGGVPLAGSNIISGGVQFVVGLNEVGSTVNFAPVWQANDGTLGSKIGLMVTNIIYDMEFMVSNGPAGPATGRNYIWTNGIFMGTALGQGNQGFQNNSLSCIGNTIYLNGQGLYRGFIQAVYVQTNGFLTFDGSQNASNIHYWCTNYLTHGRSP